MNEQKWKIKNNRFVLIFDILGFKDLVMKIQHNEILDKLKKLKSTSDFLANVQPIEGREEINLFKSNQTQCITFSDSIFFLHLDRSYLQSVLY